MCSWLPYDKHQLLNSTAKQFESLVVQIAPMNQEKYLGYFIQGFRPEIRSKLLSCGPPTLDRAFRVARSIEFDIRYNTQTAAHWINSQTQQHQFAASLQQPYNGADHKREGRDNDESKVIVEVQETIMEEMKFNNSLPGSILDTQLKHILVPDTLDIDRALEVDNSSLEDKAKLSREEMATPNIHPMLNVSAEASLHELVSANILLTKDTTIKLKTSGRGVKVEIREVEIIRDFMTVGITNNQSGEEFTKSRVYLSEVFGEIYAEQESFSYPIVRVYKKRLKMQSRKMQEDMAEHVLFALPVMRVYKKRRKLSLEDKALLRREELIGT